MMIYKTANGDGFNPLLGTSVWLNIPATLQPASAKRRVTAYVNTLISTLLLIQTSLWVSGILQISTQSITESTAALVIWRSLSYLILRQGSFPATEVHVSGKFRFSVFTVEWFIFYCSLSLYLLCIQTIAANTMLQLALSVFIGVSICLMLIPPIQGSVYKLRESRKKKLRNKHTRQLPD